MRDYSKNWLNKLFSGHGVHCVCYATSPPIAIAYVRPHHKSLDKKPGCAKGRRKQGGRREEAGRKQKEGEAEAVPTSGAQPTVPNLPQPCLRGGDGLWPKWAWPPKMIIENSSRNKLA